MIRACCSTSTAPAIWCVVPEPTAPGHPSPDSSHDNQTLFDAALRTETPPVQTPVAEGLWAGVLRNLRAGSQLAFMRGVDRGSFQSSAEVFVALAGLNVLLLFLLGVASVGVKGQFNVYEFPRALLFVPATLLFALMAMRISGRNGLLLPLAVALTASGLVLSLLWGATGLLLLRFPSGFSAGYGWLFLFYGAVVWWALVIAAAVRQLVDAGAARNCVIMLAGWVLLVSPVLWYPQNYLWMPKYDDSAAADKTSWAPVEEYGFYAQQGLLDRALAALQPGRPGVADTYLLAAGLYAREDVFMKEVQMIADLFRQRFDAGGRSVVLLNNAQTLGSHPVASMTSIAAALQGIGSRMNPDEDLLVMYVSSHGSESHHLAVDFPPLRLTPIDPPMLKRALDASGIKWRVIVVSACYSGGFVTPLQDEHTMIITASSAARQSFGCGTASDATYLGRALFDEELRKTYSFETAFAKASSSIAERERAQGFLASEPQIFVGARIRGKLAEVERRLHDLSN